MEGGRGSNVLSGQQPLSPNSNPKSKSRIKTSKFEISITRALAHQHTIGLPNRGVRGEMLHVQLNLTHSLALNEQPAPTKPNRPHFTE